MTLKIMQRPEVNKIKIKQITELKHELTLFRKRKKKQLK